MSWQTLSRLRDRSVPKLGNLRRASRAGLRVPPTVWAWAADLDAERVEPPAEIDAPWIVRSASPTEDTDAGTAAGQFVTRAVRRGGVSAFRQAVGDVVRSLPVDARGRPRGAVFVQPLLAPERGGVAFFDGFYFERTTAPGGNPELTSGRERGEVVRGTLRRADPWSEWLSKLARAFARELRDGAALDVEFAEQGGEYVLLQARPARFPLARNPLLSLANHREILGDPPSPWMAAALEEAGSEALSFFAEVDPRVAKWGERYAVRAAGRAWLNFSFFHRLMDHWGLPRAFVTEGVGGHGDGPADERFDWPRMIRSSPRLVRLQVRNVLDVARSRRLLAELDARIEAADDLGALFDATAFGLGVALRVNFAINGALTGLVRVRRALGIRGRARVTTEEMMESYDAIRALPQENRAPALDAWLERFGHRGPLESELSRPRFAELRDDLLADLMHSGEAPGATTAPTSGGVLFALDRRRESFRDELMRAWARLRAKLVARAERHVEAGDLASVDDAFLLERGDFESLPNEAELVRRRAELERLARLRMPTTATRDEIEARLDAPEEARPDMRDAFEGIALGRQAFEGHVRKADDLVALLRSEREASVPTLTPHTVLVVPALEPSWAVVFGRVGAVVTELGGELSHASILLREAGKPAIVNCAGSWEGLRDGERVRLDGVRGRVERLGTGRAAS